MIEGAQGEEHNLTFEEREVQGEEEGIVNHVSRKSLIKTSKKITKKTAVKHASNTQRQQNKSQNMAVKTYQVTSSSKKESPSGRNKDQFKQDLTALIKELPQIQSPKIKKSPLLTKDQIKLLLKMKQQRKNTSIAEAYGQPTVVVHNKIQIQAAPFLSLQKRSSSISINNREQSANLKSNLSVVATGVTTPGPPRSGLKNQSDLAISQRSNQNR